MTSLERSFQNRILSVSELTSEIKRLLESTFPFVWLTGEVSNFSSPISGHFYFTLKDASAQIRAVMFRGQNRMLKFVPEDGMVVTGLGRIGLYEPRGTYQVIFEHLEPKGVGALQVAFERLKRRLADEGLFDDAHKRPIPGLPRKIAVITSPSGAVVHDILKVALRRFPNLQIEVWPVRVQGDTAVEEISDTLDRLNRREGIDVAILARGGGSLEDLQAFNSESVARAIFACQVPLVSAVGHETDYTIADFVADLRAPTPSAAAELIVPKKSDLEAHCETLTRRMKNDIFNNIEILQRYLQELTGRISLPRKRFDDLRLRIDDITRRLGLSLGRGLNRHREKLMWRTDRLLGASPAGQIAKLKENIDIIENKLFMVQKMALDHHRGGLAALTARLSGLNPAAVLDRGYSITRTVPDNRVVKDAARVSPGQKLRVTLARGDLAVEVRECRIRSDESENRT